MRTVPLTLLLAIASSCGAWLLTEDAVAAPSPPEAETFDAGRYAGRPLQDLLLGLREQGLRVVFTDRVVPRSLDVGSSLTGKGAEEFLAAALAEHGLTAVSGARGTLVIVAEEGSTDRSPESKGAGRGLLQGLVRAGETLEAVAGARVRLLIDETLTHSDREGSFAIPLEPSAEYTLLVERPGYLPATVQGRAPPEWGPPLVIFLDPAPVHEDEVDVTPSRLDLLDSARGGTSLDASEIEALPHLGGDLFRALSLLPGVASNDVTATVQVRGARRDETAIVLDGLELIEPFHLADFDQALSLVSPHVLGRASLSTGGVDARFGDRMSGVLDLTTREPISSRELRLGLSLANASLGGSGTLAHGRGHWIGDYRLGSIDLVGRLLDEEDPEYWDAFGKLAYSISPRQDAHGSVLFGSDRLSFQSDDGIDRKLVSTRYDKRYVWGGYDAVVGRRFLAEVTVGHTRGERDRRGEELEEEAELRVVDRRELDLFDLRHAWSAQWSPRHSTELGADYRRFASAYDYTLETSFDHPLTEARVRPESDERRFDRSLRDHHSAPYLSDRWRVSNTFTLQAGVRFDRFSLVEEEHWSPRLQVAWALARKHTVRASWGEYRQSQRVNELLVEDDELSLFPVESAEQVVVGVEREFVSGQSPITARIEAYRRDVGNPRPRFENLYEPINTFPEAEPDRVRIAPERSRAEGIELFLRRRGARLGWWVNYSWSSTEDTIAGVDVPRSFDQTHALNLDLDLSLARWKLNLAWRYRTGWPTTPLSLVERIDDEGEPELVPELGPLNGDRLPDYHRLDVRISRTWERSWGDLRFFADVQNLYDRPNVAGFDFEIDDEAGELMRSVESWVGLLPSLGIELRF